MPQGSTATVRASLDRVCIVMMSAVGDAVHVLPVLTALKRHRPDAKVTWILQPGPATLVRGHPDISDILLFERGNGWRAFNDLRRQLATRRFDLALALQVYLKAGMITRMVKAPVKLGFDMARARDMNWVFTNAQVPPHAMQHVQDQYLEFLDTLGVPHAAPVWNLGPWAHERGQQRERLQVFDRPIVPIVIATSKPQKDWLPERWAAVCDALYGDFGVQPVLVGGRTDRELAAERTILQQAKVPVVSALGSGLRGLVQLIDGAALVLSPDTGPLHITVALDRPVVSLIGYSNPKRVGPYRKFHDLMIDAYGDPGEAYPISMANRLDRLPRITVDDVLAKVQRWHDAYATPYGERSAGAEAALHG
ncbi:MAG TPA: glycosyltransferase family 9 protein [Gemmatimonadaceae bacterium]|nr:glycosyltransferase family 9 protein [Gemmatimonadaceae bacterium]